MTTSVMIHLYDNDPVGCRIAVNESRPDGYPVLELGTIEVFPTIARLRRIHEVTGAVLAILERADDCEDVAAEADGNYDVCLDPFCKGRLERIEGGASCLECGTLFATEALLEASRGAKIIFDPDGLIESMASSYEVRRESD